MHLPVALIERSQFAWNRKIYEKGAFKELLELGFGGSWLEWFLLETESFHGEHFTPLRSLDSIFNLSQPKLDDSLGNLAYTASSLTGY